MFKHFPGSLGMWAQPCMNPQAFWRCVNARSSWRSAVRHRDRHELRLMKSHARRACRGWWWNQSPSGPSTACSTTGARPRGRGCAATRPRPSSPTRAAACPPAAARRRDPAWAGAPTTSTGSLDSGQRRGQHRRPATASGAMASTVRNLRPSALAVCWQRSAGLTSTRQCAMRWLSQSAMRLRRSPLLVSMRSRSGNPRARPLRRGARG